jgi:hypothetical protein
VRPRPAPATRSLSRPYSGFPPPLTVPPRR